MRGRGQFARFALAAWVALGSACSESAPGSDGESMRAEEARAPLTSAEHALRREGLRRELRIELGAEYDGALPELDGDQLALGAELWELLCANCHGTTADGRRDLSRLLPVAPGDLTDPIRATYFSDRAKLRIISHGSPGTPMVGWTGALDESAMKAVLGHLKGLIASRKEQQ